MSVRNALVTLWLAAVASTAWPQVQSGAHVALTLSDGPRARASGEIGSIEQGSTLAHFGGTAFGYANLETGLLQAGALSPAGTASYSFVLADVYDQLSFNDGASGTAFIDFHWHGTLSPADRGSPDYASLSVAVGYAGQPYQSRVSTLANGACPHLITCTVGTSIDQTGSVAFDIRPGATLVMLSLEVTVADRRSADFSDPARFALRLPDGVTYTSASGRFLAAATPVPEPGSLALMCAGLGATLVLARRRRR